MLATLIVLSLIVMAFWRSLLRFVLAALLVLIVVGGVQAVRVLDGAVTVTPPQTQCTPTGQNHC